MKAPCSWSHLTICCWVTLVGSDSVRPHRWQPTRLPHPWGSLGKNTGVGCHFFLQCMKGKSESEVAQSCPIPCDPMDCGLPGSSIHGILQARVLEWGAIAFSNLTIYLTLIGCALGSSHWREPQRWRVPPSHAGYCETAHHGRSQE